MASLFNLGVLGMLSQSQKMVVIGNNIANSATTSFKAGTANFAELFITNNGQLVNGVHNQFGNGVQLSGVTSDWSPGSLHDTSSESNLAIEGDGFLGVRYPDQYEILYTRAGDFALVEAPASINNTNGYVLMRPNGVILCGNHESELQADGTFSAQMKPVYFYAQKWDSTAGGGAGAYVEWNPDPISAGGDGPVPSPTSFLISAEGVLTAQPEGPTAGNEKDGDIRVVMRLDGDTSSYTSMRIGIQRFNNPDSLEHLESGMYRFTAKTSPLNSDADGKPKPSAANSNGCGRTRQGMLELSNVDLVNEFTEMIVTQRAFQANSKTITTADEMLQTVMGLKR